MAKAMAQTGIVAKYLAAKEAIIDSGFAAEIDWQEGLSFGAVTESDFLREGAWVILSSGMREATIRSKFAAISGAFHNWESAEAIVSQKSRCRERALSVFAHEGKIGAIITLAERIYVDGFEVVRQHTRDGGVAYLRTFPYLGPATSYHLAKNLGLEVVKPDRHLLRVSQATGFGSPTALCQAIAESIGEKVSVVDLVIWRFATLNRDHLQHFAT